MAATYNEASYMKMAKHLLLLFMTTTQTDITKMVLQMVDQLKNIDDLKALQTAFATKKGKTLVEWLKWREQYNKGLLNAIAVKLAEKKISLS